MQNDGTDIFIHQPGSWIKLRTLILLRWMAIFGQISALGVGTFVFELNVNFALCFLIVCVSAILNLISTFIYPENHRLSERQNAIFSLFDLLQLGALLFFTGGLNNPFALLILGPVVAISPVLRRKSILALSGIALAIVTALMYFHVPITTQDGAVIQMPSLFVFGMWVSVIVSLVFITYYTRQIGSEVESMSRALQATQMALSREQKLTDLGGIVAATAHELGTPLATIKLTSSELMDELQGNRQLYDDAQLIYDQAGRCHNILRQMGKTGTQDVQMTSVPLSALIEEAAEPHLDRGIDVNIKPLRADQSERDQPFFNRRPEIVHGLRNLIQNAVDFASTKVVVTYEWADNKVLVRIEDDGPGFSPQILARVGDPFVRGRSATSLKTRPNYEGMGLGVFISKTLLERSGAHMDVSNSPSGGAVTEVVWSMENSASRV